VSYRSAQTDLEISASAKRLYSTLALGLQSGEISETQPVSGKEIAARAARALGRKVTDEEVRSWVHYLRAKLKVPVGSNSEGYFLCAFKAQWVKTQAALIARIKNQKDAAYGPDEYYQRAEQQNLFHPPTADAPAMPSSTSAADMNNHPVVQELKEKFGAVQV